MPFLGLGLHVFIALFFAVHAVRSGQNVYWVIILFSFPLLGSIVYFFVVYLPNSRLEQGARTAIAAVAKSLDPTRELREARAAFEFTPTAQNQMRLAEALLESGAADEAATTYVACLKGAFTDDLEIKYGAARAFVKSGQYARAITFLDEIRTFDSNFRAEQVSLLLASALACARLGQKANAVFEEALSRFGSFAVLSEYAVWAIKSGDKTTAMRLQAKVDQTIKYWDKYTHDINRHHLQRINAAYDVAKNCD